MGSINNRQKKKKKKKEKEKKEKQKDSLKITNPNAHYIFKSISGLLLTSLFKNNLFCLSSTHLLNKKNIRFELRLFKKKQT